MTMTIAIRFPLGRFHATTWGHAVNEGASEWPPSPWRLSRALYAAWKWRLPEIPESDVLLALSAISDAPLYSLPRYTKGHTRHYMPRNRSGKDKIFDSFVLIDPREEILMRWNVEVSIETRAILAKLCDAISYLGRAESIVDVRLFEGDESSLSDIEWVEPGASVTLERMPNKVLVSKTPFDESLLVATTTETRKAGRVTPLGARWVSYPSIEPGIPSLPGEGPEARDKITWARPTAVLLRFGPPVSPHVLPSCHQAVLYGDTLRKAALDKHDAPSMTLSGRSLPAGSGSVDNSNRYDEQAKTQVQWLRDDHKHAHFIALDLNRDRMLDAALVWTSTGLNQRELEAIASISNLRPKELSGSGQESRPVRVFTEAWGKPEELVPNLCKSSRFWTSVYPFAPYRHQKRNREMSEQEGLNVFLKSEVNRELQTRGLAKVSKIEILPGNWLSFDNKRKIGDRNLRVFGLKLTFEEAISGPLLLGAQSHFGLGLFRPEEAISSD